MSYSRREITRFVGYAVAGAVVAVPIALAAASWSPLESVPRSSRSDQEDVAEPRTEQQRRSREKEQKQRPDRDERRARDSS